MLIPTFLLYEGRSAAISPDTADVSNLMISFEVDVSTLSVLPAFYKTIFGLHEKPFCILLSLPGKNNEGIVPHLDQLIDVCLLASFHYRYLFFKFLHPFIAVKGSRDSLDHCTPIIIQRFQSQGFAGIDYQVIEGDEYPTATVGNRQSYLLQTGEDFFSDYEKLIKNNAAPGDLLFIKQSDGGNIRFVTKALSVAEDRLNHEMPKIYQLLAQNRELTKESEKLNFQNSLLKERLESELSYRSFYAAPDSGYKKQVKEIADFYNKEYEILPLWYKQFGHIIKVLTGKRTFKSLFNDNVKKYRD